MKTRTVHAAALIALMILIRTISGHALFRFRMNNGFRAHDCDGSCGHHGDDEPESIDERQNM